MSETDPRPASADQAGRGRLADRALNWPNDDIEDIVPETSDPRPAPAANPVRPAPVQAPARSPVAADVRRPSQVYSHLVEGEDDVIGLVAYALYKQDKREFLESWEKQRGTVPTGDQLEAFSTTQLTAGQRERYRTAARQVLDAYAGVAVESERGHIVEQAVTARIERAAGRAEAAGSFWRLVGATFIGFLLFALVAAVVLYAVEAAGIDVASYLPQAKVVPGPNVSP